MHGLTAAAAAAAMAGNGHSSRVTGLQTPPRNHTRRRGSSPATASAGVSSSGGGGGGGSEKRRGGASSSSERERRYADKALVDLARREAWLARKQAAETERMRGGMAQNAVFTRRVSKAEADRAVNDLYAREQVFKPCMTDI